MKKLSMLLCALVLVSCGGSSSIGRDKINLYLSGLSAELGTAAVEQLNWAAFFVGVCGNQHNMRTEHPDEQTTVIYIENCLRNGVAANGKITAKLVDDGKKEIDSGSIDFEVRDSRQIAAADCRALAKEGDKAGCAIDVTTDFTTNKATGSVCGLELADLPRVLGAGSCGGASAGGGDEHGGAQPGTGGAQPPRGRH